MLRLIIGLRIIRGPRGRVPTNQRRRSIKRRALLAICCVLIAAAATHPSAGRAARQIRIGTTRESIRAHTQEPASPLLPSPVARQTIRPFNL